MGYTFSIIAVVCLLLVVACTPIPSDPYTACLIPNSTNSCRDACLDIYSQNSSCTRFEWESNYKWAINASHLEFVPEHNETQCNTWFINSTNETGTTCFNVTIAGYNKNVTTWKEVLANCTCWLECSENMTFSLSVDG